MKSIKIEQAKNGYIVTHCAVIVSEINVCKTKKEMIEFVNKYFYESGCQK